MPPKPQLPSGQAARAIGAGIVLAVRMAAAVRWASVPTRLTAASLVLAVFGLAFLPLVFAQSASKRNVATKPAAQISFAKGEITRLDPDRSVVTLKHGPIENMGMPDMTMVFRLAHPEQAIGLKVGDRVQFRVEKIGGTLVVVELVASR